ILKMGAGPEHAGKAGLAAVAKVPKTGVAGAGVVRKLGLDVTDEGHAWFKIVDGADKPIGKLMTRLYGDAIHIGAVQLYAEELDATNLRAYARRGFEGVRGYLGNATVRSLLRQLQEHFPEAKTIEGIR